MMAPFLVLFCLFTVLPILSSMVLSFTYFNMLEMPQWRGFYNYIRLFLEDDVFLIAVKNTLMFAFLTGPVSYIMCFVFAWFINELTPRIRAFMTLVFYAPSMCGSIYVIWTYIFDGDAYGLLNSYLLKLNILDMPIQWLTDVNYNVQVIVLIQLWLSLGTSFLAFMAGFKSLDQSLAEAGAIDGIKNRFQELVYITIPQMKNILLFGAVMQISSSFAIGAVPMALGGFPSTDYSLHTVMVHIYDYGQVRYEMGYASAIAFLLCLAMIGTNKVIQKLLKTGD
ncbi:MAG: sugar ABC transporter permease [Bacillota bacterium]|nr:sugar ABC transporter permease [Bacillota bacterium]